MGCAIIFTMKKNCELPGCHRRHYARGYCEKHYQRLSTRGAATSDAGHHEPFEVRFWFRVKKTITCWEWIGPTYRGYGRLWHRGKTIRAHRASWVIHHGDIPHGMFVCHRCDNPKCVNPDHLFLGTHRDNIDDKVRKGRCARLDRRGEKGGNAKLAVEDVLRIRRKLRPQKELAVEYGVDPSTISDIQRRKTWTNI